MEPIQPRFSSELAGLQWRLREMTRQYVRSEVLIGNGTNRVSLGCRSGNRHGLALHCTQARNPSP
jgi:hypothetical protein